MYRHSAAVVATALAIATSASAATGRVEVHVVDAGTSQPLPARLVLKTSDGQFPGDRIGCAATRWPNIEAHGIFIDGSGTFEVPPGSTSISAAHGAQFDLDAVTVEVKPGETAKVELKLKRIVDLRANGWVGGDAHVHMIHGENQRTTSYQDVATTCAAGGLDFVSVCQEYVGAGTLELDGYRAACDAVSTDNFRMFLGAERPKSILGHQALIGAADPFVIAEDPPYFASARVIHAQGGASFYVHPVRYYPGKQHAGKWLDFPGTNLARELVFDAYCGPSFDGLSVLSDEPANSAAHALWFNLLNRGFFVPVLADGDACFDRPLLGEKAPGFWTTYFYIGPGAAVTEQTVSEALREGRTVATTGPLLEFEIDGQRSGATLPSDGSAHTARITAHHHRHAMTLESTDRRSGQSVGVRRVELIRNGEIIRTWEPQAADVRLEHTVKETGECWYAVRALGSDERWQVAIASPIYFAPQPVSPKHEPAIAIVRGRIYDFRSGDERAATVVIHRGEQVLKTFSADGQFRVAMPLDAEIRVEANGERPITKNLLLDYGPIHRFLWYLESNDLARPETFERFERLLREVDLEFPLGFKLPGCYLAQDLPGETAFESARLIESPPAASGGAIALAAVFLDTERVSPSDTIAAAAIFCDEGGRNGSDLLVVEARGYDPARPTAFGALKKFAEFEKKWDAAIDLGGGYRMIVGSLRLPAWVRPGPTGGIDISARARRGSEDLAFVGLAVPLGPTKRSLCVGSGWPIMPISWADGNYGIGPLKITGRAGTQGQPRADYRRLHVELQTARGKFDICPARDAFGCPDADDAAYTERFLDETLSAETRIGTPDPVRPQPSITWRAQLPTIDATHP